MKRVDWSRSGSGTGTQEKAVTIPPTRAHLVKSQVGMEAILEHRLKKGLPLKVISPLVYSTSIMEGQEEDDGFYLRKSASMGKYIDARVTIPVGVALLLKSVDSGMKEFIFTESGTTKEHAIPFIEKNSLMVNTDIFEVVQNHLKS